MEATAGVVEEIGVLDLRPGELVEVRSEGEILRTLDSSGMLESLPFMPEMLKFCGKQFRVYKRADKACDTIERKTIRRMHNAVHLAELRCDGAAHGGCQAGCLMYWKEAWLKRVGESPDGQAAATSTAAERGGDSVATTETLVQATRAGVTESGDERWTCQATELLRAAPSRIPFWDPDSMSGTSARVMRPPPACYMDY